MKLNSVWKAGLAALIAAGTVIGATAVSDVASALPAGTPPFQPGGGVTLTTGTSTVPFSTPFNFTFSPAAACQGDNNTFWSYSTYITSGDPATLTFGTGGNPIQVAPARTAPLKDAGGTILGGFFPSNPPSLGAIIAFNDVSMAASFTGTSAVSSLAAGVYNVGVACYNANAFGTLAVREVARYWNTQITVTGSTGSFNNGTNYVNGVAPAAPLLGAATYNPSGATRPTVATLAFPAVVATPGVTGYTATVVQTVTPPSGAEPIGPIALGAAATSVDIPDLEAGETYTVTVTATNLVGTSVASNTRTVTGDVVGTGPGVNNASGFQDLVIPLSWSATTPAATSYDVVVTGPNSATTAVFSQSGVTGTTVTIPAAPQLALGNYTITVTPNLPAGTTAPPGVGTLTVNPNALIFQDVTVERPEGALVLTQRCGVYGLIPEYGTVGTPAVTFPTAGFPGYPKLLGTLPAIAAGTGITNAPPVVAPGIIAATDPRYGSYPQRGSYPTLCNVTLGNPTLVTSGPLTGQYYAADGRLNQVTVLNTRNTAAGWVANGDIANEFKQGTGTSTENNSFSGDLLGWIPQVTSKSATQTVTAGPVVLPGTAGTAGGLTGNPVFAFSPSGQSLGIAELDARLMVLVPVTADSGLYTARMSLTVI